VIALIRASSDADHARASRSRRFRVSDEQAQRSAICACAHSSSLEDPRHQLGARDARPLIAEPARLLGDADRVLAVIKESCSRQAERYATASPQIIAGGWARAEIDLECGLEEDM